MKQLLLCLALIFGSTAPAFAADWSDDQKQIIEVNRWVPLALKEAGFESYAKLFHPEYTNWYMRGDKDSLTNRAQFLGGVKTWFEKGNYATFSYVEPISIEIFGDLAYVRHLQEEHFIQADGSRSKFVGHFASLMKKHEGKWTFFRTSFQERYRGPINEGALTIVPDEASP